MFGDSPPLTVSMSLSGTFSSIPVLSSLGLTAAGRGRPVSGDPTGIIVEWPPVGWHGGRPTRRLAVAVEPVVAVARGRRAPDVAMLRRPELEALIDGKGRVVGVHGAGERFSRLCGGPWLRGRKAKRACLGWKGHVSHANLATG